MINITHDGIEIRNDFFLALFRNVFQSLLANGKCIVCPFCLIISYSKIEIEFQHIRIGFNTCLTKPDHFFIIFFTNRFTQKRHTGGCVGRIYVQHLFQHRHCFFIHPFGKEILGIEHRHLCIVLILFQDTVEKSNHASTILACPFILNHKLAHHIQFSIGRYFLVQQKGIQLLFIEFFLSGLLIVGCQ